MSNKKQLVLDAFNNKATERVPVGFWFHFAENELGSSYEVPAYRQQNLEGHKKFVKEFQPDFVKLMSDGYFFEPETAKFLKGIKSADDLFNLKPISENDKWILDQVSLVKELTNDFGKNLFTAYNVFAPATAFKWGVGGDKKLAELIKENQDAVFYALSVISQNTQVLAKAVIKEGHADGIYLSVQSIQDVSVGPDLYSEVISPSEIAVLAAASSVGGTNILHVCGYEGAKNNLSNFKNYPAKVINFASVVEGISLKDGKKIFKNKAVIGGFANTKEGLLYKGSREDIQTETKKLLADAGKTGIILGADCTVPKDIDWQRLEWVREAAK